MNSDILISLQECSAVVDKDSSASKEYSKVGNLYSEQNTPQLRWFKGSRDRGIRGDFAD